MAEESKSKLEAFYEKRYKLLLLIPVLFFIFSIIVISIFYSNEGNIVETDVSLKGGISATIYLNSQVNINELESSLKNSLKEDFFIRSLAGIEGSTQGILIETTSTDVENLETILKNNLNIDLNEENFFVEETGGKLGEDFY